MLWGCRVYTTSPPRLMELQKTLNNGRIQLLVLLTYQSLHDCMAYVGQGNQFKSVPLSKLQSQWSWVLERGAFELVTANFSVCLCACVRVCVCLSLSVCVCVCL